MFNRFANLLPNGKISIHSWIWVVADLVSKSQALLFKEWRVNDPVHENYNAITGEGCDIASSDRYYNWDALLGLIGLWDCRRTN